MTTDDWHTQALCAKTGGDWWYAELTTHYQHHSRRYTPNPDDPDDDPCPTCIAITICELCEVKTQCLTTALNKDERHGIWGGLTPEQRIKIRRRRGIPPRRHNLEPCGTTAAARRHQRRNEPLCPPCSHAIRQDRHRRRNP